MRDILSSRKSKPISFSDGATKIVDPLTARAVIMFYDSIKDPKKRATVDQTIATRMGFKAISTKAAEVMSGAGGSHDGEVDNPLSRIEKKVKNKLSKKQQPTMEEDNLTAGQKKAGQLDATEPAKKISPMIGNTKQKMHPFNGKLVGGG